MYLVKALVEAKFPDISGKDVMWVENQTGLVSDDQVIYLLNNPASWTVLAGPDMDSIMAALSDVSAGDAPATDGISATNNGVGVVNQTVLTLEGLEIDVADADAYGSAKIYEFPAGRILVLGVIASLQWAVTTPREDGDEITGTINDDAALEWSIGSAAASDATLADAMVDLLPKTSMTLAADDDELNTASTGALAASAQFDGTDTAIEAYLNVGFETDTEIDADGTLAATGSVKITWVNLGDY
jgi:hypothetical protein